MEKWTTVIFVVILAICLLAPVAASADVVTNLEYDLPEAIADSAWTKTGNGAVISNEILADYTAIRSDLVISGSNNFMIEATYSSTLPSSPAEAGARLWVKIRTEQHAIPVQFCEIQVRLMKDSSDANNFIGLYSHTGSLAKDSYGQDAKLVLRWDQSNPRYRIRLMRQGDQIVLEAEPSDVWDDNPIKQSVSVALGDANFPPRFGGIADMKEIGFGNALASGNQTSTWESIHVTVGDDDALSLPYWPPSPPAPILAHDSKGYGNPQGIDSSANFSALGYLTNDSVTPYLDADNTTYTGSARINPGNESWDFDGLDDTQTVSGYLVSTEVSGRSTLGSGTSEDIPYSGYGGVPIPQLISYQGYLINKITGIPIEASVSVAFSIYETATGGGAVWTETHSTIDPQEGLFSILLGDEGSPIIPPYLTGTKCYIGLTVGTDSEMLPRQQLASVPYALRAAEANNADTLDGRDADDFADTHSLDASDGSPTDALFVDAGGNVGIGTTNPTATLTVAGTIQATSGGYRFPDDTVQTTAAFNWSYPDGFENITPILKNDLSSYPYTVPSGKNLYITNIYGTGGILDINGYAFVSCIPETHLQLPIIVGEGTTFAGPTASVMNGFVVDAKVSAVYARDLLSNPYTVPLGKNLIITHIYGPSGPIAIDGTTIVAGSVTEWLGQPIFAGEGQVITSSNSGNLIMGYLIDN